MDSFLQVGHPAPKFDLEGYFKGEKRRFSLDDYKGKWTVLFFYPLDFTFVCPTELVELSKRHKELEELNAQALGVSVDSVYSHEAWLKELGEFEYPLLSDMTKETSLDYEVLLEQQGIALRGVFIISPDGILKSMTVNDLEIGRSVDEILRVLEALQTGELCPVGWKKGDKTLGSA
ncbi:peroxiredoxin [Candidatus Peregrinibacteria bacterium]|nr:peroxiredoxin [Candidatus Peregrinibacteria bacterium]MBT7736777.1 peroxiredoxin [Candidatus Peregrinibacteria bacterium]